MQSPKFLLLIAFIWLGVSPNSASICGPDSVPHRFTAYPTGEVEVGCSKPSCFESQINGQTLESDPFYRTLSNNDPQVAESAENFHLSVYACEQISPNQQCPGNTFLFEAAPSITRTTNLVCCSTQHTPFTHENLAYVPLGQEIVGGKVLVNNQQTGFDYISDVTRTVSQENQTVYQVRTKRLYCPDHGTSEAYNPFNQNNQRTHGVANVQGAQGARTHDVPTVVQSDGQDVVIYRPLRPAASAYRPPGQYYPAAAPAAPVGGFGNLGGLLCFSGDTEVIMSDGETKRMDELKVGDWILSMDESNKLAYGKVKSWIHKLPQQQADFLKISLSDGNTLKITPQHLIYKADCSALGQSVTGSDFNKTIVASDELRVGDCLYTAIEHSGQLIQNRIEDIEIVTETGIYAPLTTTGNLVVNNVLASCYSVADYSTLQTNFAKFVEKFGELSRRIFGTTGLQDEAELPMSSQLILQMAEVLLPSLSF